MNFKGLLQVQNIGRVAVLFGTVLLCFVWVGLYVKIQDERQLELNNASKDAANYARAFAEHTERTVRGLDEMMLFLKYQAEKEGLNVDIPQLVKENRFSNQPFLALAILNESGDLVASSNVPLQRINNSDRDFFSVHINTDSKKAYISKPYQGRASGKMAIQMTRRINKVDGSFGGVVVVAVDPNYFADFYKQVDLGEKSVISLIGLDGIVRVRQSGPSISMGMDFSNHPVMNKILASDAGTIYIDSPIDGSRQIISFRRLSEYPLFVHVGVSEEYAFGSLKQRVIDYYYLCGGMSAVIVLFVILLVSGASQRNKAESELKEKSAFLTSLLNAIPAPVFYKDLDGRYLGVNKEFESFYGQTEQEIIGKSVFEIAPPELARVYHAKDLELLQQAGSQVYEATVRDACGCMHNVVFHKASYVDTTSHINGLIGVVLDITERKKTEEKLEASKARYQALLDQSYDAVAIVSPDTQEILEVNQRFTEWFGYSLPKDAPLFFHQCIVEDPDSVSQFFAETLPTQKHVASEYHIFKNKQGHFVNVERTATMVQFEDRELVMINMRNLTQDRQLERDIARDARHARRVQEGLLPELRSTPMVDVWAINHPSHVVSGDFYHLEWNEDETVLRGYLVDVSGHGMATAIQAAAINVLLHEVTDLPLTLAGQMAWINRRVSQYFADDAFAAAIAFELDLLDQEVRYVASGITEFFYNSKRIIAPGLPLGIKADGDFSKGTLRISAGDFFAFLTDGLTDVIKKENLDAENTDFGKFTLWLEKMAQSDAVRDDATAVCFHIRSFPETAAL